MSYLKLGSIAGPFEISGEIASGTSSIVYEARNVDRDEFVALKVFHPQLASGRDFSQRLEREVEALKRIQHPNVVHLYRAWELEGRCFLELELVRGRTLQAWAAEESIDWIEPRLWILAGVARALGAVHEEQIVHRDFKPENILVSKNGQVKLTDFGLAKPQFLRTQLTQTGSLIGSLAYMAPETASGGRATYASDIFSFGILAYEVLTGVHPFIDDHGQLQLQNLLSATCESSSMRNPRVPHEVDAIISQCLQLDPARRPRSIWSVEASLLEYLQAGGLLAFAKHWVEFPAQQPAILPEALCAKHAALKTLITTHLAQPERNVRHLVSHINEFHALFPNDAEVPAFLASMRSPLAKRRYRWSAWKVGVAALILAVATAVLWSRQQKSGEVLVPRQEQETVTTVEVPAPYVFAAEPEPVVPAPRSKKPRRHLPVRDAEGSLQILAEVDVVASVDGLDVPRGRFANYRLSPGEHHLRLEKPGFPPLERVFRVSAGKTTTINTIPRGDL